MSPVIITFIAATLPLRHRLSGLLLTVALVSSLAGPAGAAEENVLDRLEIVPRAGYTRIRFKLEQAPDYALSLLPGKGIRLIFHDTRGALRRKLRAYADANIGGVKIVPRGPDLQVDVAVREQNPGYRTLDLSPGPVLTLDVGPSFRPGNTPHILPGRERIWSGAEQLLREFDPPLKSDLPFAPTDRRELQKIVSAEDTAKFLAAESLLYKGNGSEAMEIFSFYARTSSPIQGMALSRLGESFYLLQKYPEAYKAFREAEKLWPQFLFQHPSATFYYADCIVRSGDLEGGRRLLGRLTAALADKSYAPLLIVRQADILSRQHRERQADLLYRSVIERFPGSRGAVQARMKLADRRILTVNGNTYQDLVREYTDIFNKGDFSLREGAFFKTAFLEAVHGPADEALSLVIQYQKKFPQGMYAAVARGMREELLPHVFRQLGSTRLPELVRLANDNRDYLSRSLEEVNLIPRLVSGYKELGQVREKLTLFSYLAEKEWAAPHAPYFYRQVVEGADALADFELARTTAEAFLRRFPRHEWAPAMREQLGMLYYRKQQMPAVVSTLSWLMGKGARPESAESFYYLGKGLESVKKHADADRAMTLFLGELVRRGGTSPLVADAHYVTVTSRLALGNRRGAMDACRAGYEQSGPTRKDQFLYKMGEISLLEGKQSEARQQWEKVAKEGSDPVWRKLAAESLGDLEYRQRLAEKMKLSK